MSLIDPDSYVRIPFAVKAKVVTASTIAEVAAWCGGTVHEGSSGLYIHREIKGASSPRHNQAHFGDFIVFTESNQWKIYTPANFHRNFKKNESPFDLDKQERILRLFEEMQELTKAC